MIHILTRPFSDVGNTEFSPHSQKSILPAVAGGLIAAGGSILGGLFGSAGSNAAAKKQLQAVRETNAANAQLAAQQNQWNIDQWNRQNEYNKPLAQRQRYEEAGINPYFALGNIQSGQADSLSSADLANQTPVVSDLQGQGSQIMGNSIANAAQSYYNGAMAQEQVKSVQLQNTLDAQQLVDKVKNLHYDTAAKKMANYVYNGSMQSLMNITKNQERLSYIDVGTKSLEQVGTSYDIAMKQFQQKFLQPQSFRLAEMSLNQMIASIAYTKAQERLTNKQVDYYADTIAIQWLQANSSWLNAKSNQLNAFTNEYSAKNQAWNTNQATYRENYVFKRTKDLLVKQIKLGVDLLDKDNDYYFWNHTQSTWNGFGNGIKDYINNKTRKPNVNYKVNKTFRIQLPRTGPILL